MHNGGKDMHLTPQERRKRIYDMLNADEDCQKMGAEYESGKQWFEKAVRWLPRRLRAKFWIYPGISHLLYHHIIGIICENMKFTDEE